MPAENAGSAPERAGRGGLRGTVSASMAVSDACGALRLTEKRVPMKLLFKQRFFSWFDSYDIYNEAGDTVYVVKGQLSWGHCLKNIRQPRKRARHGQGARADLPPPI